MVANLTGVEKRIVGEVYSSSEAIDNLMVLCDDFGGRLAGTPENRAAAEFIKAARESPMKVDSWISLRGIGGGTGSPVRAVEFVPR